MTTHYIALFVTCVPRIMFHNVIESITYCWWLVKASTL